MTGGNAVGLDAIESIVTDGHRKQSQAAVTAPILTSSVDPIPKPVSRQRTAGGVVSAVPDAVGFWDGLGVTSESVADGLGSAVRFVSAAAGSLVRSSSAGMMTRCRASAMSRALDVRGSNCSA
jgi:hypothetical protein